MHALPFPALVLTRSWSKDKLTALCGSGVIGEYGGATGDLGGEIDEVEIPGFDAAEPQRKIGKGGDGVDSRDDGVPSCCPDSSFF